jgi:hypothetical protein
MTDESYEQRRQRRQQAMIDEFSADSRAKRQAEIDRFWQARIDDEEEYRRRMRELDPTGLKIW